MFGESNEVRLDTNNNTGFASTLAVICHYCNAKEIVLDVQIYRTKRKVEKVDRSSSGFKVHIRKLYNKLYHCRKSH